MDDLGRCYMSDRNPQENDKALLLEPENFTPARRTPWGGHRIVSRYKPGSARREVVGESWEISVEPDFPSRVIGGALLSEAIASDAGRWLGDDAALGSTALLVKLLDAKEPLSVQIHPADDDPRLGPGESGKPEAWYVLEADADAALYVGLREGVDELTMREAITQGGDVSALLERVPVGPGDFFVIEPGTPHAIGAGITLVEPQRVLPGRRGLTYRYWDWNRRYDADGRLDPRGEPRTLHVEEALAVTDWSLPRGAALLERIRSRAGAPNVDGPAHRDRLSSAPITVDRLSGSGALTLPDERRLRGLTVLDGQVRVGDLSVTRGRSAVLAATLGGVELALDHAHAVVTAIP